MHETVLLQRRCHLATHGSNQLFGDAGNNRMHGGGGEDIIELVLAFYDTESYAVSDMISRQDQFGRESR